MNKYESVVIFNEKIPAVEINKIVERFINKINEDGKIEETEDLGIKRMAYEVKRKKNGRYSVLKYETESQHIPNIERLYRQTEEVLKFITVRNYEN